VSEDCFDRTGFSGNQASLETIAAPSGALFCIAQRRHPRFLTICMLLR
jgi:hypothetical protein